MSTVKQTLGMTRFICQSIKPELQNKKYKKKGIVTNMQKSMFMVFFLSPLPRINLCFVEGLQERKKDVWDR